MIENDVCLQLDDANKRIQLLERELKEMSNGITALNLELESRVDDRTEELRQKEQFLENVFNSIQDGIVVIDNDKKIVKANPWVDNMYSDEAPVESRKCYEVFKRLSAPCSECQTFRTLKDGLVHQTVLSYPPSQDPSHWFLVSSFPFTDPEGEPLGVIEHIKDITKQKHAEDSLKQTLETLEERVEQRTAELAHSNKTLNEEIIEHKKAQKLLQEHADELERSNREIEMFSYSVSHDLRTPLRAVDGFTRILQEEYSNVFDDEGRRILSIICKSTKKMGHLIEDILKFSRAGRSELVRSTIDMKMLSENIIRDLLEQEYDRSIEYTIGQIPKVRGDRSMMREALFNLIANAMKYTRSKDAAEIEITGHENGKEVIYSIRDNGIGFDMRYYNKLFGVFQRLHTDEEVEGTGIGLAIVKQVVERHGGRVWADGEVGMGATFSFSLPK